MLFDDLLNTPAKWMVESRDEHDIVLTSRIRLARNLTATPFPGWATRQQRADTLAQTSAEARQLAAMKGGYYAELSELDQQKKQLLVERHLISRELAARAEGCAVLVSRTQNASILFNEEDHLRLQYILPGIQLKKAWAAVSKIDSELEDRLPYAYNTRLGYITACPTNLGTGMRASVMMHLPGLVISEQMQQVVQAAVQLNITIRGLYGEGTEATGNLFQISNQSTLGDSEEQIVERMTRFTADLANQEWNARRRLLQASNLQVKDRVSRAYGLLTNATLLSTQEALGLLSFLRMGASLDIFSNQALKHVNKTIMNIQPAHLAHLAPAAQATPEDRDQIRANIIRKELSGTQPNNEPTS